MLDTKQITIIEKIIQSPIWQKKGLAIELGMTDRQLEYTIEKINALLKESKIEGIRYDENSVSTSVETYKYLVNIRGNIEISTDKYIFSKKERVLLISLILINGNRYISLLHLQDYLGVSQSTISKDLKVLENNILRYNLHLNYDRREGYKILGRENDVRTYLNRVVASKVGSIDIEILDYYIKRYMDVDEYEVEVLVRKSAEKYGINFVENRITEFSYIICINLKRLKDKPNYIQNSAKKYAIENKNEYQMVKYILLNLDISNKNSVLYITMLCLCSTIGEITISEKSEKVFEYNRKFINNFQNISGISFEKNNKIVMQMYTHFRSMFYRVAFEYPIYNPLTAQIKKKYNDVFKLVEKSIDFLGKEFHGFPEEEIAYLTIHLVGFIYKENNKRDRNIKAVIICSNGVGTSALAYLQLTSIFPNIKFLEPVNFEDLKFSLNSIDLIFSTQYKNELFTMGKPVFIIKSVMSAEDKYNLVQRVYSELTDINSPVLTLDSVMEIVNKKIQNRKVTSDIRRELQSEVFNLNNKNRALTDNSQSLLDVLTKDFIQPNIDAIDAIDAIGKAANPLLEKKYITNNYLNELVKEENMNRFIISPLVALPHTKPINGAKKIGLSIASLQNIVYFNSIKPVRYIFIISTINNYSHLPLLNDLITLISDKNFLELLSSGANSKEIYWWIQKKLIEKMSNLK
ncbi:BglG family transcription antiterminator [Ligilactobacillus sp. WILCCON 0076]|uniref:BglG family transcription antiterminator n=1 Tax=Ligilactobacillus ubinensis TaxID=2876789 RepID=A0A9X2JMF1_9LACO|nr:BglG family transcription antiterminator [Ligilactobacillus ubinensis]MCP0888012.1 BglG family transcription antiterminator [Ligilactobacillus ubinensis]